MIDNLRPLTQEQRQGARKKAREAVIRAIGPKPAREHFNQSAISKYPPSVTRLIFLLCLVLLLAAFTPSAIRLYVLARRFLVRLYQVAQPKQQLDWLPCYLLKSGKLCFHWRWQR